MSGVGEIFGRDFCLVESCRVRFKILKTQAFVRTVFRTIVLTSSAKRILSCNIIIISVKLMVSDFIIKIYSCNLRRHIMQSDLIFVLIYNH